MKIFLIVILFSLNAFGAAEKVPDLTAFGKDWKPRQIWPAEKVDAGGFHLGGANSDETLRKVQAINGIPLAELEKRMRPQGYSAFGFLGKDEHLIDVLRKDNAFVVEKKKSSHRQVALALQLMADMGQKVSGQFADKAVKFRYLGQTYEYRVKIGDGLPQGFQANPFSQAKDASEADEELTTSGSGVVTVKNLSNRQELSWSTMMPFLIQRYGFYEGEGTRFRVAPEKIFALLPFLK